MTSNMKNEPPSPRTTESLSLMNCVRRVNEPGDRPNTEGDPHRVAVAPSVSAVSEVAPARRAAQLRSLLQSVLHEILEDPDLFDEDEQ